MRITELFDELKCKDIICWGSGKHFRNLTYPFLVDSGLIRNVKGFVDMPGIGEIRLDGKVYDSIMKKDIGAYSAEKTVLLISAVGYKEILSQIKADTVLKHMEAIPAIFLEALYEDILMLSAPRPLANYRKNERQMIPKVIHSFWFSDKPGIPEKYRMCLESWKRYAPDMEIKIWDLNSYRPKNCLFFDQAVAQKSWAFASDYARADVLRRYGGVYMDMDVEMLKPIDDLLYNDAYMSFESLGRIECGSGMGARKGHPILEEICRSYESRPFIKPDGTLDMSTCPVRFTQVIEKHGLIKNGGFQFVDDITIYPFEVLTGKSFDTGIIYRTELSYTLHHHNGSWVPNLAKNAMEDRYREIAEFLAEKGYKVTD